MLTCKLVCSYFCDSIEKFSACCMTSHAGIPSSVVDMSMIVGHGFGCQDFWKYDKVRVEGAGNASSNTGIPGVLVDLVSLEKSVVKLWSWTTGMVVIFGGGCSWEGIIRVVTWPVYLRLPIFSSEVSIHMKENIFWRVIACLIVSESSVCNNICALPFVCAFQVMKVICK